MNCPQCGKFMRRDGIGIGEYYDEYWRCRCGCKYTISEKAMPFFSKEAFVLIPKEVKASV